MNALLLVGLLACDGPKDLDDTGLTDSDPPQPTRDRREGEQRLSEADVLIWGGVGGDDLGTTSIGGGQGWALAVAAPGREEGTGLVGVFAELPASGVSIDDADALLPGARVSSFAGVSLLAYGEGGLAVGAFWDSRGGEQAGAVSLYPDPLAEGDPAAVLLGDPGQLAGGALAVLGDQDGDGALELAIGAQGVDLDENDAGAVVLISADLSGAASLSDQPEWLLGRAYLGWFGVSLASGDLNGDGVSDLVVGAMSEPGQEDFAGAAHVFFGPNSGAQGSGEADIELQGQTAWGYYGQAVASGQDVDGDGLDDLLVSAPDLAGGTVYLYRGGLSGAREAQLADAIFTAEVETDRAGFSLDFVEDRDGDGFDEVLIGATRHSPDEVFAAGAAYLIYGPHQGTLSLELADWTLLGVSENARAGVDVQDAGDLDGDGFSEILVGARGEPAGGEERAGVLSVWL